MGEHINILHWKPPLSVTKYLEFQNGLKVDKIQDQMNKG